MLDFYYAERQRGRRFPIDVALNDPGIERRLETIDLPARYLAVRRAFEIGLIVASLPIVIPVSLITALCIVIDSPGPAIYWQYRPGKDGRMFRMLKFRSMRVSRSVEMRLTGKDDDRITRFGRFIRMHRIDELPQLWNVIRGEMSLIGPRPEPAALSELFERNIPLYRYRRMIRPGITGWAQVKHGYAADIDATRIKLEDDLYYILNLSFDLDLAIVVRTIRAIARGYGAR